MRISDWSSDVCSSDLRAILYSATNAGWGGQVQPRVFIDADKRIVLTADFVDQTGTKLKGVFLRKETPTGEQVTTAESGQFALSADRSRSEEHASELQSLMRISYAVFCLKNKQN